MGVGRTVYKGEVKTGVFAWFCAAEKSFAAGFSVEASLLAIAVDQQQ